MFACYRYLKLRIRVTLLLTSARGSTYDVTGLLSDHCNDLFQASNCLHLHVPEERGPRTGVVVDTSDYLGGLEPQFRTTISVVKPPVGQVHVMGTRMRGEAASDSSPHLYKTRAWQCQCACSCKTQALSKSAVVLN